MGKHGPVATSRAVFSTSLDANNRSSHSEANGDFRSDYYSCNRRDDLPIDCYLLSGESGNWPK